MFSELLEIQEEIIKNLKEAKNTSEIEKIRVLAVGKHGKITLQMQKIKEMPHSMRKEFGLRINTVQDKILTLIEEYRQRFVAIELNQELLSNKIDVTLPSRSHNFGKKHIIIETIEVLKSIAISLGFDLVDGPEIEDEWHNFTALNIPYNHPTRQLLDTFYMKEIDGIIDQEQRLLLRTHTSNVQIRVMKNATKLPLKFCSIGKVYRADHDSTHLPMFHQMEFVYLNKLNKDVTIADLKGFIEKLLKAFFFPIQFDLRFRNSYFPFTEPSMEVDISMQNPTDIMAMNDNNNNEKLNKTTHWMEVLGAGMIHPEVLKNTGLQCRGFAIGAGIERLAMLKHNITDMRIFYEGDMRYAELWGR